MLPAAVRDTKCLGLCQNWAFRNKSAQAVVKVRSTGSQITPASLEVPSLVEQVQAVVKVPLRQMPAVPVLPARVQEVCQTLRPCLRPGWAERGPRGSEQPCGCEGSAPPAGDETHQALAQKPSLSIPSSKL